MITLTEIQRALIGAYRLARVDPAGMQMFDASLGGFWRSFTAAAIAAPFHFVLLFAGGEGSGQPLFRVFAIEGLAYVIAWVMFPLAMIAVCDAIGRAERYLGFIVASNWSAVMVSAVFLVYALLTGFAPGAGGVIAYGWLILYMLMLAYAWYIASTALSVSGWIAALVVGVDLGVALLVNRAAAFALSGE